MAREAEAALPGAGPVRLAADCMLGKLARWLRILGYDTAYERSIEDTGLIARCAREGRILLTRDNGLAGRRLARGLARPVVLVLSDRPEEQLAQVIREVGLPLAADRVLSRCLECNEPLEPSGSVEARGHVPPYVLATQRRFARCPACGRFYWRATHVDHMMRRLAALLP